MSCIAKAGNDKLIGGLAMDAPSKRKEKILFHLDGTAGGSVNAYFPDAVTDLRTARFHQDDLCLIHAEDAPGSDQAFNRTAGNGFLGEACRSRRQ